MGIGKMIVFLKHNFFKLTSVLLLIFFTGFLCCDNRESRFRAEIRDLRLQLAESRLKADTFYIHDSVPVWRERIVEVDRTDYKQQLADKELIKALRLRVSELESEQNTLLSTGDTSVLQPESDSIVSYRDKWCYFVYSLHSGVLDWEVRDSLSTFVGQYYKHHFLFWKWGKRGYVVTIVNHNPRSRVEYNQFIKIK